jgi:beta-xylosidase
MWIPMDKVFDLGEPGPSGNENDTYVSGTIIYKVNNLLNSGGIVKLLDKVLLHNLIFPNTAYILHGFAGYDKRRGRKRVWHLCALSVFSPFESHRVR